MKPFSRTSCLLGLLLFTTSCAFHSTATRWNGMRGPDGKPVFVKTTTNVGFNLLIVIPFLGNTTTAEMIDGTTEQIANEGGSRVRMIQSGSENYWYGWSPFTWFVTPVVTDIAIEYEPSDDAASKAGAVYPEAADQPTGRTP